MAVLWHILLVCWVWTRPCWTSGVRFKGTPRECQQAQFVPGYNLGGEGFDITTMMRKGAHVIDTEKWMWGKGKCTLYRNAYMNNVKQKIPAAMVDWKVLPKCSLKISSSSYSSVEALIKDSTSSVSNDWKLGLNLQTNKAGAGLAMGGTHSVESSFCIEKSKEDRYEFFRHSVKCGLYSYRLRANPPLSSEFMSAVGKLSPRDSAFPYQALIDTYGTHYITKVSLGGEIKATSAVRTCLATLKGVEMTEIKDCLSVEASLHLARSASITSMMNRCKAKLGHDMSFSSVFNERLLEVIGGNIHGSDVLFQRELTHSTYNDWMDSLKTSPDMIQYSLKPLHTILPSNHPARATLKTEVEKYIKRNAVLRKCSESCVIGHRSNKGDPCACVCANTQNTKHNCCPAGTGFATLKVFGLHARGLYGDRHSQTDGSVLVQYGPQSKRTSIISNDDNPNWGEVFSFGQIQINKNDRLNFTVYDEDSRWNSDLLGHCSFQPRSGIVIDSCRFEYGTFFFSYKVECAHSLGGDQCQEYVPSPMSATLANVFYSRNGVLLGGSPKGHEMRK